MSITKERRCHELALVCAQVAACDEAEHFRSLGMDVDEMGIIAKASAAYNKAMDMLPAQIKPEYPIY